MNPRVSICTSVLNQSEFLKIMIESVIAQTFTDWELIIVDDGSTEDIAGLVQSFSDSRIVYERFPENKGIPHGMNHAFSLAIGDYFQPLSADEFIWDRKLEIQVSWMDEHPDIGCTWGLPTPNIGQKWPLGEAQSYEQYQHKAHNRSNEAWIRTLLRQETVPIGGASMLMRRSCYEVIGDFDPQFFDLSDLEWFVRFFQNFKGWILPYRFADAVHPDTRLTAPRPGLIERYENNLKLLHAKHKIVLPPMSGRVTIGIPVRNMEKFVAKSVQSVLDQTFKDFDLVLLDDASEDGTLAEIQKFDDPRITLMQIHDRIGVAAANNHILATCKTDFYVPFSADDVLEPTFLERCLAEFTRDPFLEFVGTQTDFIDVDGAPHVADHPLKNILRATNKSRDQWLQILYYGNNYFGAGMYRTIPLIDIGGWDSTVGVITDYDVYLKLLQRENIHVIEENLTHTRIHDGQQSIIKTREHTQKLRNDYHIIHGRYYAPRMKVIIATPFYELKGFTPYISSLVATIQILTRMGIENEFWEVAGDSYIDRAKNTLVNKFLEDPAATDLFMIDADMQWNPHAFVKMLMLPHEIIMGSYPQKNGWDRWTAIPATGVDSDGKTRPIGQELSDGNSLIAAAYLAGGFIRMKRDALQKYKDDYPDLVYHDAGADPSYPERKYTEFFTCERKANDAGLMLRWGEDRVFGARMEKLGIKGWIYPNVDIGHYGVKGWIGNFDKHLRTGATAQ